MSKHTYKYTYSKRTYTLMQLHQNNLGTVNKRDDLFLQLKIVSMQPDHFIHAKWTMFSPTFSASMIFRCYGRLFNAAVAFPLQFANYWLSSSYGREKHTQSHTSVYSMRENERQTKHVCISFVNLFTDLKLFYERIHNIRNKTNRNNHNNRRRKYFMWNN